jgi:hypothetical protein
MTEVVAGERNQLYSLVSTAAKDARPLPPKAEVVSSNHAGSANPPIPRYGAKCYPTPSGVAQMHVTHGEELET